MRKPILVVNYCISGLSRELMIETIKILRKTIDDTGITKDYYTFLVPTMKDTSMEILCPDKQITKVKMDELKRIIYSKIEELGLENKVENEEVSNFNDSSNGANKKLKRSFWTKWF